MMLLQKVQAPMPIRSLLLLASKLSRVVPFPVGGILYVPFLQKYFMLEDQCAECDKDLNGQKYHIDLYMGPADHPSSQGPLYDCEGKVTRNTNVILKPASNLPVDTNPLFQNNQCTAHLH